MLTRSIFSDVIPGSLYEILVSFYVEGRFLSTTLTGPRRSCPNDRQMRAFISTHVTQMLVLGHISKCWSVLIAI